MKEVLFPIHIKELPEGGFLATSEELPGLVAQGRTVAETSEIAQDVAVGLIESYLEHGDELPPALASLVWSVPEEQQENSNDGYAEC